MIIINRIDISAYGTQHPTHFEFCVIYIYIYPLVLRIKIPDDLRKRFLSHRRYEQNVVRKTKKEKNMKQESKFLLRFLI